MAASANNHSTNNKNTETTTHVPSTNTIASPRPSHIVITQIGSTTAVIAIITTTANEPYSVLELYEEELQKIKEVKEELKLAKKKREIEHDERMIQMKKKISLLLQLKGLEQP